MPRVPTYDTPQVAASTLPNSQVRGYDMPDVVGKDALALGRGMMEGGNAVSAIAAKQMQLDNQASLDKEEAGTRGWIVEWHQTHANRVGEAAAGLTQAFSDDLKKFSDERLKLLPETVRQTYSNRLSELALKQVGELSTYESKQKHAARLTNNEAASKALMDATTNAPFEISAVDQSMKDSPAFGSELQNLIAKITERGVLMGLGEGSDAVKRMHAEARSAVYAQRVSAMINNNPGAALAYFKGVREHISDPTVRNRLDEMSTKIDRNTRVEREVETLWDAAKPEGRAGLTLRITRDYSGDDQRVALGVLRDLTAGQEAGRAERQRTNRDVAWKLVFETPSLKSIPNDLKLQLQSTDHEGWNALVEYVKGKQATGSRKTDPNIYHALTQMQATDPKAFKGVDLRTYIGRLSEPDFEYFVRQQGDALKPEKIHEVASLSMQLNTAHNLMKFGRNETEKKGQFDRVVTTAIQGETERQGRNLSMDERQKIIDRMMLEGTAEVPGWFNDFKGHFYQVQGTPNESLFKPDKVPRADRLGDVPPADQAAIRAAAPKGSVVTPAIIIQKYNQLHGY